MKYRTKLYIAFVITAIISVLLAVGITYFYTKTLILKELRSKVKNIVATTAVTLDIDSLKQVLSHPDESSDAYKRLQKQLSAIRNANRRDDIYVKYIYTLMPSQDDKSKFIYLVDSENGSGFPNLGDVANEATTSRLNANLNYVYSPKQLIENEMGSWLIGYAPIYDTKGKYLATLGVSIDADDVIELIKSLINCGIISFLSALLLAILAAFFLARRATVSLLALHQGVKAIDKGILDQRIRIKSQDEFAELASEINTMAQGLQERQRLQLNFTRYVSQHVMESILQTEGEVKLSGERRKITFLFSDIRQFSRFAEKSDPEQVVSMLNEYFSVMVEIIFKNHGTLDKFLGDGLMVEFGAPLDDDKQEFHAVQAALEMKKELNILCDKWEQEGRSRIEIGIGIHTGYAVIGNIGSERRIEYTAIGDTVNVAARLEQLTKELKVSLIISEATVQAIKNKFPFKSLGAQQLRGRNDPIVIYTLE